MSTPQPPQVNHLEHVAEQVVADVVSYVRGHPAYGQIVESLGGQALRLLAAEAGIAI